jgi:hypothetical protein
LTNHKGEIKMMAEIHYVECAYKDSIEENGRGYWDTIAIYLPDLNMYIEEMSLDGSGEHFELTNGFYPWYNNEPINITKIGEF